MPVFPSGWRADTCWSVKLHREWKAGVNDNFTILCSDRQAALKKTDVRLQATWTEAVRLHIACLYLDRQHILNYHHGNWLTRRCIVTKYNAYSGQGVIIVLLLRIVKRWLCILNQLKTHKLPFSKQLLNGHKNMGWFLFADISNIYYYLISTRRFLLVLFQISVLMFLLKKNMECEHVRK